MKKILVRICLAMIVLVSGCTTKSESGYSTKSEYYIEKPKENQFSMESVSELQDSDVELIKEFLPKVTEWYNTIDISKEQSIDFVANEVDDLGQKLFESPMWNYYLDNFASGNITEDDEQKFQQIQKANAIYGKISVIMMTSEMSVTISTMSEESNSTMTIDEDIWIELGDCIKEAIDYYYQ